MRKLATPFLIGLFAMANACIPVYQKTQLKVRANAIRITDASTGGAISEVLLIPHYCCFKPPATPTKEESEISDYAARPFIYLSGRGFKLPDETNIGLAWFPGMKFIGHQLMLEGILVLAPGYQPQDFYSISVDDINDWQLTPISAEGSSQMIGDLLSQIEKKVIRMPIPCRQDYARIVSPCVLGVRFNKNERKIVRSFLQRAMK
jgi:hypothetical protein